MSESNLNNDDALEEADDKGELLPDDHCRLSISVVIPASYFKSMTYDTFLAYTKTVSEEVTKRLNDAAIDEWFRKQPLYNEPRDGWE